MDWLWNPFPHQRPQSSEICDSKPTCRNQKPQNYSAYMSTQSRITKQEDPGAVRRPGLASVPGWKKDSSNLNKEWKNSTGNWNHGYFGMSICVRPGRRAWTDLTCQLLICLHNLPGDPRFNVLRAPGYDPSSYRNWSWKLFFYYVSVDCRTWKSCDMSYFRHPDKSQHVYLLAVSKSKNTNMLGQLIQARADYESDFILFIVMIYN